eukprot:5804772-Prymnesium_polylepis.2
MSAKIFTGGVCHGPFAVRRGTVATLAEDLFLSASSSCCSGGRALAGAEDRNASPALSGRPVVPSRPRVP